MKDDLTPRQQRLYAIILIGAGMVLATALTLYALRDTVTFFYSPADLLAPDAKVPPAGKAFRVGGLVVAGSVSRSGETLRFEVTDTRYSLPVLYSGIVPNLFKEGQGVVATGRMAAQGRESAESAAPVFIADTLLAKHDENYMPPEIARAVAAQKNSDAQETGVQDTGIQDTGAKETGARGAEGRDSADDR